MSENSRRILKRDRNPHLFRPLVMRSVKLRNRIMMSPMCQYSAADGMPDDWHRVHLGSRAVGGAGIVFTEATHVAPEARITPHCLGIWNDRQRDALASIAAFISARGAVPALQIAHAGRKASTARPWEGSRPLPRPDAWQTVGPSALPYGDFPTPRELSAAEIAETYEQFAAAAKRGRKAGFRLVEIHAAHGYLIHSFLSPLSNRRTDRYGGALENRARFLLETIEAVRSEWPEDLPMFVRLSCSDWVEGGLELADIVMVAKWIAASGDVDLIDCSSGGNDPRQRIPIHPGYQVPFAETVRREAGIATAAVGLLHSPDFCEEVVANGRADIVALGRAFLADPHWPLQAARKLGAEDVSWPVQYERANIF